jgi:hypothetical protein
MLGFVPLLAEVNLMWFAAPLIVSVSLVYSATRHEAMSAILSHAMRLGLMITGFMAAIFVALAFVSSRL